MRAFLDGLYRLAGAIAAVGMIGTLVMVSAGIFSRPLGIYLPGTDDYAGYSMATCGFLALAYTFKHGEHIRVTLVLERLGPQARRAAEWLALALTLVLAGMLAWYAAVLVIESYEYGDVSQGVDATPLWIPQLSMAVGVAVFFIALLDDFIVMSLGGKPSRLNAPGAEVAHSE